jgi:hypothetical protein
MYGLPQAGILANKLLAKCLARKGYYQCCHTPGLRYHTFRPICFALVVDDFGVKYVDVTMRSTGSTHYGKTTKQFHAIGKENFFCGINLDWDYNNKIVKLSMPNYIEEALLHFQHPKPTQAQYQPHPCNTPQYGAKVQMTDDPDNSPLLNAKEMLRIQQIVRTLLYYARAVDSTLVVPLSAIASEQSNATEYTHNKSNQLLDYCATLPMAILQYVASNMQLRVHLTQAISMSPRHEAALEDAFT